MARKFAFRILRRFSILLILLGFGLIGLYLSTLLHADPPAASSPAASAPTSFSEPAASIIAPPEESSSLPESPSTAPEPYPTDKLFVTSDRLIYRDGDLVLRVPRLNLTAPVVGAIDEETRKKFSSGTMTAEEKQAFYANGNSLELLAKGVMIFNLSPLPDEGNANVSISGHRDIYGCEFYSIDTITDGDLLYLDYLGREFCYEYLETVIVAKDDWSPIYCRDFSCLTLISCDPIGTSRNRIVVTAKLIGVVNLSEAAQTADPPPGR